MYRYIIFVIINTYLITQYLDPASPTYYYFIIPYSYCIILWKNSTLLKVLLMFQYFIYTIFIKLFEFCLEFYFNIKFENNVEIQHKGENKI